MTCARFLLAVSIATIFVIKLSKSQYSLLLKYKAEVICYAASSCKEKSDGEITHIGYVPFSKCCNMLAYSARDVNSDICLESCKPDLCFMSAKCEGEIIDDYDMYSMDDCCNIGGYSGLIKGSSFGVLQKSICVECPTNADDTALHPPQGSAGIDPHFAVLLTTDHQLCFTVQGEQGFVFNLVHSPQLTVNALFIPDEVRDKITWIGSLAVIIEHPTKKGSNKTTLRFEAKSKIVHINEQNLLIVGDNGLHITLFNGVIYNTVPSLSSSSYVLIDIKDIGLSFSVEYVNQHLDIVYYKIPNSGFNCSYRGLLGQFFCPGYSIDEVRKLLLFPSANREPVPVMRRPIWSFMEREKRSDNEQICWMAMNAGYQGEGLLEAHYLTYIIPDLFSLS